jgi:alpha-L-fucosidase
MMKKIVLFLFCFLSSFAPLTAQQNNNKKERELWFSNLGFGMFIHWGIDVQLGAVISHSLAGASKDFTERFIRELPQTFDPENFNPDKWASLAKLAGMKYVVFTAKHHSGFCMFNTRTTSFNIVNTPYKKDITKEVLEAFRRKGIAVGLYFSPEDFYYLYKNDIPVGRLQHPQHYPVNNTGLMEYDKRQLKELLTAYGKIDILFLDGPAEGLKEFSWQLQPDLVITRGQMETPEQQIPGKIPERPWEACFTMGTDWQYKPTNDPHKNGTTLIKMLVETRSKGGNLLLNVGPMPDGKIQIEQEALLREIALWNFVNREAVHDVEPWNIQQEGNTWFTYSRKENAVYAIIYDQWKYGERKEMILQYLMASDSTKISVLGYDSHLVEYKEGFDAALRFEQTNLGLLISAVNGQRFYTNNQWPNPVVLKITHANFRKINQYQHKKPSIEGAN